MQSPSNSQADEDALAILVRSSPDLPSAGGCPDEARLAAHAEGRSPPANRPQVEEHMAVCADCRRDVARLVEVADPSSADAEETRASPAGAAVPDAPRTETPTQFGPYRIVRRIGAGGMGVVYEVIHPQRGRHEALKVLKGGLGLTPEFVERFRVEMQTLSSFEHEHVVRLYDSGQIGDEFYFTMPLVPGASLAEVVRDIRETGETAPGARANEVLDRHRVPHVADEDGAPPEAVYSRRIAASLAGVADALARMHARDIVHRDVKPGNLMLDADGRVLLADFGLVRTGDVHLTQTGAALGTPAYMSPEQVLPGREKPDGRSDVYALGATLYELLTMRVPHQGTTTAETMHLKLKERARPVRELCPGLPEDIEVIVSRCLEIRAEDRYQDAARLAEDLAKFARGVELTTKPLSPVKRGRNWFGEHRVPIFASVATLAAAGVWFFARPARLSVTSVPPAQMSVDADPAGTTPIRELSVGAGKHTLRLVHPKYEPYVREIDVARGTPLDLPEIFLRALDPADPEALRLIAAALKIDLATVDLNAARSDGDVPLVVSLFPRGLVREAPTEIRVWAEDVADGLRVRLVGKDAGAAAEPLAVWTPDAFLKEKVLPLAPDVAARLVPGGEFAVEVVDAGGKSVSSTGFRIASAEETKRVTDELAALTKRFAADDPMAELVATEYLLGHGYAADALGRARDLEQRLGARPEVARMGLAALDRAGLRGAGQWAVWARAVRTEK